jgi:hypothetical protein
MPNEHILQLSNPFSLVRKIIQRHGGDPCLASFHVVFRDDMGVRRDIQQFVADSRQGVQPTISIDLYPYE